MTEPPDESAQQSNTYRLSLGRDEAGDRLVQRWTYLRELMIRQLEMFEAGGLTLRSQGGDVSGAAITDLKASILEFDALICRANAGA